jgi:hypothetical protein
VSLTCVTIALATAADRDVDLGPIVDACPGDHPDLTGG